MSDEFESSSNSDIKEFINQDGDFYMNFDAQQIKKQLISMNQKKQVREENIDEQKPEEPLKFIPVKNHIESTWAEADDRRFLECVKNTNEDWAKIAEEFKDISTKDLKYHYQVLQQIWSIE